MTSIRLTWPPRTLSPNGRAHWSAKYKATKTAKTAAFYLAKEARLSAPADGPIAIHVTAYPLTRNKVDADNIMASCKAYFDGIAAAMGVDDSRFRPSIEVSSQTGGYVVMEVG